MAFHEFTMQQMQRSALLSVGFLHFSLCAKDQTIEYFLLLYLNYFVCWLLDVGLKKKSKCLSLTKQTQL